MKLFLTAILVVGLSVSVFIWHISSQDVEVGMQTETMSIENTEVRDNKASGTLAHASTENKSQDDGISVKGSEDALFGPELIFGNEEDCDHPINRMLMSDLIDTLRLVEEGYVYANGIDQFENGTQLTVMSSIGRWLSCGEKITLIHPPTDTYTQSASVLPALAELGWHPDSGNSPNVELSVGTYKISLSMENADGSSGGDSVYMRTTSGDDAYVEFVVVSERSGRYGEEDGMPACPCSHEYVFFISEQYPLNKLVPRVEAEYAREHGQTQ